MNYDSNSEQMKLILPGCKMMFCNWNRPRIFLVAASWGDLRKQYVKDVVNYSPVVDLPFSRLQVVGGGGSASSRSRENGDYRRCGCGGHLVFLAKNQTKLTADVLRRRRIIVHPRA